MLGMNGATDSKGRVELYEKGYGKDAAGIAKEAISYGTLTIIYVGEKSVHCGTQLVITTLTSCSSIPPVGCKTTRYVNSICARYQERC